VSATIILLISPLLNKFLVPIKTIKELRSTSDARYYREQFQLAQEYEDRWLTIVYIIEGNYKTLHLIASSKDIFQIWDSAFRKLYSIRQELMGGLGNVEMSVGETVLERRGRWQRWEIGLWGDGEVVQEAYRQFIDRCAIAAVQAVRVYGVVYTSTHSHWSITASGC
jgi:hypothetical protein